jgi:hypothetical protein
MYESFPFKIKDVVFSSILYVANKYMIKIANIIGVEEEEKDTAEIREWMSRTEHNFYKYFFPHDQIQKLGANEQSLFYDYDLVTRQQIKKKTVYLLSQFILG